MADFDNGSAKNDNVSQTCDYCFDIAKQFSTNRGFPVALGYVVPPVILVTMVTNTLVMAVLLRRHMRTSTNILLAGLAFSDTMCSVFIFPVFINFFTLRKYKTLVQFDWCLPLKILIVFSTGFHTTSVFQTIVLAAQRYIFICKPTSQPKLSVQSALKIVAILHIGGILVHATNFVDVDFLPIDLKEGTIISRVCMASYPEWVDSNFTLYVNVYFWFRAICLVVLPCIALIILTGLLLKTITVARKRRKHLFEGRADCLAQQGNQNIRTTLMLVIVVCLFLICEIPNAVVMTVDAVEVAREDYCNTEAKLTAITTANIMILLSSPANIFLYCGMSKRFRNTLKQLFVRQ